ncbi:MAG: TetR/AcrR family transcriptional regulator [Gammaproteobacteria bacterium]|nr:TetR/AcrR family transcriptional regulator [Gammaproteobacteria bacterium]MDH5171814.1 TetR/AcrR family transcriptional regulator [Gammaproteobacteria bacterium]
MARTQSVSDDEIFAAARNVFERRGLHGFTLTDVASEVGLSRAAIILRFESTHALKVMLMARLVDEFIIAIDALPDSPGGDNLLQVAAFIGGLAGNRGSLPAFFSNYVANLEDPDLAALEKKRGEALHRAILRVMPETRLDRESAASAFNAHLTGTIMNWVAVEETDSRAFVVRRSKDWLRLAGIPYEGSLPGVTGRAASRKQLPASRKSGSASRRSRASTR